MFYSFSYVTNYFEALSVNTIVMSRLYSWSNIYSKNSVSLLIACYNKRMHYRTLRLRWRPNCILRSTCDLPSLFCWRKSYQDFSTHQRRSSFKRV